ncbi:MAG: Outer membrane protein assembly factor BamB [Phycisphaerae bacterium]|nr:Outer membrane protein assembly factor BamB [Phycisphaerae bacterium]
MTSPSLRNAAIYPLPRTGTHVLLALASAAALAPAAHAQWPQWGGPNRDFRVAAAHLPDAFPDTGPRTLWSRELGDGYSAISAADGVLYTMAQAADDEIVLAINAADGKDLWQHRYTPTVWPKMNKDFGVGPRAAPLIVDDRVYTIGCTGLMLCLDRASGKPLWSHELDSEFGATQLDFGYSTSPMRYKNNLITFCGGKQAGVIAFDLKTGDTVWKSAELENSYSSPIVINVGGQDQVVAFMATEVVGLNAENGEILWRHPQENRFKCNVSTPSWADDGVLFVGSAYDIGSSGLKLTRAGGATRLEVLWSNPKMRVNFSNTVRDGEFVYGMSGDDGPVFFSAINVKTGKLAWRERGYKRSSLLLADGKLVILDEDGNLMIATASPDGAKVLSKHKLLEATAWTAPTLVGDTLYLRDRKKLMAVAMN